MGNSSPSRWEPYGKTGRPTFRLDRQDPYLRLHCVTIFVRDQDRSLRFYLDQLGFSLVGDVRFKSDYRWVAVAPPDGSAILALVAPKPGSKEYKLIGRRTPVVFVTEDVLAKFKEWRQRGVRFQSTPRLRRIQYERQAPAQSSADPSVLPGEQPPIWGAVFTRFQDVDGNSFALVGFDEISREIEAQRRAAAEKLEAERRAAQELDIAKQVQAKLFPQTLPCLRTLDVGRHSSPASPFGHTQWLQPPLRQLRLWLPCRLNLQELLPQCPPSWPYPRRALRPASLVG